jgi:hypothetical protein
VLAALLPLGAVGCAKDQGEGELHARLSGLEREADGLRASLAKVERGERILPEDAVVVAVSESVVKQFVDAQLPFEAGAENFKVRLERGEAIFRGTPAVRLSGAIWHPEHPDRVGEVSAMGALEDIRVDAETNTLRARLTLDHVDLVQMGGLERLIRSGSLNELARAVRKQLEPNLPEVQIPVNIERAIHLPDVDEGPVRVRGASMPLEVSVAEVFTGQGVLWVAIRVVPGVLTRDEPAAAAKRAAR